jgi:hypothetical protein
MPGLCPPKKRIAMWSGPRNLSTALMRSWENRPDTAVYDEPLYAHYLQQTGRQHPGGAETLASQETDWRNVVNQLTDTLRPEETILYQKQMAHHLLPHIDLKWLEQITNCLLIREPSQVLLSLAEFLPSPCIEETGLPQQWTIYERLREQTGRPPLIIDAADLLQSPRSLLTKLCDTIGVPFFSEMLTWPPGARDSDGVWGKHWYTKVYETTGFKRYQPKQVSVPSRLQDLLFECQAIYRRLYERRLQLKD